MDKVQREGKSTLNQSGSFSASVVQQLPQRKDSSVAGRELGYSTLTEPQERKITFIEESSAC